MSNKFEFVSTTDKPALLAFSTPEWMETARTALAELGYKIHTAATHGDFLIRFSQVRYQLVIIEERFAANDITENLTLQAIQQMPMSQRRHATIVLLGDSFQTFTPWLFCPSRRATMPSSTAPKCFLSNSSSKKLSPTIPSSSTASAKRRTGFTPSRTVESDLPGAAPGFGYADAGWCFVQP